MLYINQAVLDDFIGYSMNIQNEVCGLLVSSKNNGLIDQFVTIPNISNNPQHYFEFAPEVFVREYFDINKKNGKILGVIHSHPTSNAYPSSEDIANWYYKELSYWIFSVAEQTVNAFFISDNSAKIVSYKIL